MDLKGAPKASEEGLHFVGTGARRWTVKCRDLMNPEVLWIPGTASVRQAASLMRDQSVGLLLVSGSTPEQFEGVVTDRDLAVRVCAEGLSLDDTPVSAVTTRETVVCSDFEDLTAAEKRMRDSHKSRLIVLDRHGHPTGHADPDRRAARRPRPARAQDRARGAPPRGRGSTHARSRASS